MIKRNWKGDSLETTQALNRYLSSVERRAFRMALLATNNVEDSLDLVQDAMLGFVQRYSKKPENEWGPLFHRTLQSRITDWYRRTAVKKRILSWFTSKEDDDDGDWIENVPDTSSPDAARSLHRKELGAALEEAVRSLPLRQQQAFLLRAWEGLDVAETAFAMGCSEGSVKTHYSRAVHSLRTCLEEFKP